MGERGSRYERKLQFSPRGKKGEKGRGPAEKLRKYEVRGEGYEFVPALMHVLRRHVEGVPERERTELERRVGAAVDETPNGRDLIERAVKADEAISKELKRRVFSPKYLNLPVERPIDEDEARRIVTGAQRLRNVPVSVLAEAAGGRVPGGSGHEDCCCCCCCPPEAPPEGPTSVPPPPNEYELTFTKLYCVDESNPESFLWTNPSDEPYAVFGVITEEMAESGTAAQAFHTPVYGDVDDGDTRPTSGDENLRLFGFAGPRSIDSSVLVAATCWESDGGDVSDTTDAMRTALSAAAVKAAAAGGVAGWVIAGVAVVGIGVSYLVDLVAGDDQINGTLAISLNQADADAMTASVNPKILEPLHFDGGDDDGIYDVYLKLRRA